MFHDVLQCALSGVQRTLNNAEYKATVGCLAIVAMANGGAAETQRATAIAAVSQSPNFKNVDATTISTDFLADCASIQADPLTGKANILRRCAAVRDPAIKAAIVQYCVAMANADDGKIDQPERQALQEISHAFGLNTLETESRITAGIKGSAIHGKPGWQ